MDQKVSHIGERVNVVNADPVYTFERNNLLVAGEYTGYLVLKLSGGTHVVVPASWCEPSTADSEPEKQLTIDGIPVVVVDRQIEISRGAPMVRIIPPGALWGPFYPQFDDNGVLRRWVTRYGTYIDAKHVPHWTLPNDI